MKSNVDLTSNRIFTTGRTSDNFLLRLNTGGGNSRFPWDNAELIRLYSDSDLYDNHKELILCGGYTTRKKKRELIAMDNGTMCDRCGRDLTRKPWSRRYDLCPSCYGYLKLQCVKSWRFKNDVIGESRDRVVIEMNRR